MREIIVERDLDDGEPWVAEALARLVAEYIAYIFYED